MRRRATSRRYRSPEERRFRQRRHPDRQQLLLNLRLSTKTAPRLRAIIDALPELSGSPIRVRDQAPLRAHRGKLVSRTAPRGAPVHAAAFIRRRLIILATDLLARPHLLRLIFVHEIFHFVWARLGNGFRAAFSKVLAREQQARARGELGESAVIKKELLMPADCLRNSPAWRDYVCESFCDTAAWVYSGVRRHAAFTLGKRWKRSREAWFHLAFESGCRC